jgi:hypothetical protein
MKKFISQIGYTYCGKWKKLEQPMGSKDKELWIKFFPDNQELSTKNGPLVYLWVYNNEIIYVGESSKSVTKRMSGHEGGFRGNSKSGRAKQDYLTVNKIDEIEVYVCFEAGLFNFLYQKKNQLSIPVEDLQENMFENNLEVVKYIEENLFIGYFNPVLNGKIVQKT